MIVKRLRLGIEYKALRTLIAAGLVEGASSCRGAGPVKLASYFAHVDRCMADPHFWEHPENLRRYCNGRMTV